MLGKKEEKEQYNKVIAENQAELDFQRFVESIGLKPRVLESMSEEREAFIKGIEWGNITVNDDGCVSYKLDDSFEFNGRVEVVNFKPRRLTTKDIERNATGKTDLEKSRRLFAVITGNNSGLFEQMKASDFEMIAQISSFFLK